MENYARDNAAKAGLGSTSSLRVVHGVSEALPLASKSCDAVVCSLTLCSVVDPARSVAEIKRVLRPGGQFVFWEHVLSETDASFAEEQVRATPMQIKRADGCHLDRRTGDIIRKAGFRSCDLEYLELKGFGFPVPEPNCLRHRYGISICFVTYSPCVSLALLVAATAWRARSYTPSSLRVIASMASWVATKAVCCLLNDARG